MNRKCFALPVFLVISSLIFMLVFCDNGNPVDDGPEIDSMTDIEGNVYKTVKIGNQWWIAENLRTTKYNDGTAIPLVTDSAAWVDLTTPGYCYYNNTTNPDSIKKFGALYSWHTVDTKKLAPEGWHVPNYADWDTLQNYLIANGYNWDGTTDGNKIAKSLAAQTDWAIDTFGIYMGSIGDNLTKNNKSGYSGLPGGFRNIDGKFNRIGSRGNWWSVTEFTASRTAGHYLWNHTENLYFSDFAKTCGFSVRLVKD